MFEQRVSGRYARALLMTAKSLNLEDEVFKDIELIKLITDKSKELKALMKSPVIQHWRKKKVFEELFKGRINGLTMEFLNLLTEKKRELILDSIIFQFETQYDILKNRQKVEIYSAVELTDNLRSDVVTRLADMTKKTILPEFITETNLIGGLMIRVGDWVFDATVKNQLETLHDRLAGIHGYEGNS